MPGGIFDKPGMLRSATMATVAERRFSDAQALAKSGSNARANGVAYLAGFVIEILLKARLVDRYGSIARKPQHRLTEAEREIWGLIWRRHDLEAMLDRLPQLEAGLNKLSEQSSRNHLADLKKICSVWTVYARYSSSTMRMDEAQRILEAVRSLKEYLK